MPSLWTNKAKGGKPERIPKSRNITRMSKISTPTKDCVFSLSCNNNTEEENKMDTNRKRSQSNPICRFSVHKTP